MRHEETRYMKGKQAQQVQGLDVEEETKKERRQELAIVECAQIQ